MNGLGGRSGLACRKIKNQVPINIWAQPFGSGFPLQCLALAACPRLGEGRRGECCETDTTWKRMKGYKLIPKVIQGVFCENGNSLRMLHEVEILALFSSTIIGRIDSVQYSSQFSFKKPSNSSIRQPVPI